MGALLFRITNWRTTAVGATGTAAAVYLFNSFGCKAPDSWVTWGAVAVPMLVGMLMKDKSA